MSMKEESRFAVYTTMLGPEVDCGGDGLVLAIERPSDFGKQASLFRS